MPDKNDKTQESLIQIKQYFEKGLDHLEQIKQDADADLLPHLVEIEQSGWKTVIEIENLNKKYGRELRDLIERNTILGRMPKGNQPKSQRIGNVRI